MTKENFLRGNALFDRISIIFTEAVYIKTYAINGLKFKFFREGSGMISFSFGRIWDFLLSKEN